MVSVRDRWHELAILRALGFGDRELRASVRWQACAMMVAGLVVGVPVGIVVGRLAWSAFAEQLGVALRAGASVAIVAVTVAGAMVLALVAAALRRGRPPGPRGRTRCRRSEERADIGRPAGRRREGDEVHERCTGLEHTRRFARALDGLHGLKLSAAMRFCP